MQAFTREIECELGLIALDIEVQPEVGIVGVHTRSLARCRPKLVDDGIFAALGHELRMG